MAIRLGSELSSCLRDRLSFALLNENWKRQCCARSCRHSQRANGNVVLPCYFHGEEAIQWKLIMIMKPPSGQSGLGKRTGRLPILLVEKRLSRPEAVSYTHLHCLAICPVDAVVSDHNQEDVREYVAEEFEIDPQRLLNFMEFRRSIRFFQNKPIEREKLRMLVEAGRYAPTGGNSQQVSYCLLYTSRCV